MNWRIEVKSGAEKQYLKLDRKTRQRIKAALIELEKESNLPLSGDVRALTGKLHGDYRLRVGDWRVLFTMEKERKTIHVYAILPRGDAY
jgi:mRNA interferase RelE/StbE